jgi:hypothetical protein
MMAYLFFWHFPLYLGEAQNAKRQVGGFRDPSFSPAKGRLNDKSTNKDDED